MRIYKGEHVRKRPTNIYGRTSSNMHILICYKQLIPKMPKFSDQAATMTDVFKTHPNPEVMKVSHDL